SDRRWSVVPRSPNDVDMGGAAASGGTPGGSDAASTGTTASAAGRDGAVGGDPAVPDVDLGALADHIGQIVRVGGLVQELAPDGFLLDDGTATGRIVLTGDATDYLGLVDPGDAVNATGRVEIDGDAPRVVVTDAAGLARVGDLTTAAAGSTGDQQPGPDADAPGTSRLAGGLLGPLQPGAAGAGGIALFSALSLAITVVRRRRARRLLAVRVGARLAGLAGAPAAPPPA